MTWVNMSLRDTLVPFQLHIFPQDQLNVLTMPLFSARFLKPKLVLLGKFVNLGAYDLGYVGYNGPLIDTYTCDSLFRIFHDEKGSKVGANKDDFGMYWFYSYLDAISLVAESYGGASTERDKKLLDFLAQSGKRDKELVFVVDVQK